VYDVARFGVGRDEIFRRRPRGVGKSRRAVYCKLEVVGRGSREVCTLSCGSKEGVGVILVPFRRGMECGLDVVHEGQHLVPSPVSVSCILCLVSLSFGWCRRE
jgi:hypothetical protein